jgi:hypothetical protein
MKLTELKQYRGRVCISLVVFNSCIGCPDIEPEVSNRRITGQGFSGFSTNSGSPTAMINAPG